MIELFRFFAALAPALVLAVMIIRRDSERPEPLKCLLAAAGLGIVAAIGVISFGIDVIEINGFGTAFYNAFFCAAVPEELFKFAMLCILVRYCSYFDEYFDGIVYCVCIGMGFAGFENVLYLFGSDDWVFVGIARALLAVPAHYFFAVIMGAFFALGYFDKANRTKYMALALILPILAHGIYDFCCFSVGVSDGFAGFICIAFFAGLKWIRKYVKNLVSSTLSLDSYPTD